jgi:hypothetical protein
MTRSATTVFEVGTNLSALLVIGSILLLAYALQTSVSHPS